MSLEELFCDVDDFCRVFVPTWHRQLLTHGDQKRQRSSRLTLRGCKPKPQIFPAQQTFPFTMLGTADLCPVQL
jgi:hypothetical protein